MEVCKLGVASKMEIKVKLRRSHGLHFKILKLVDSNLGQSLTVTFENQWVLKDVSVP